MTTKAVMELNTQKELIGFFNAIKSEQRANIVTRTPVRMNKTCNPFKEVYKVQTTTVDLNVDYEQKVNEERMVQNGDVSSSFKAEGRVWGKHVNGAIVEKDETFYLSAVEVSKVGEAIYENGEGKKIEFAQIEPFMPSRSNTTRQGIDNAVKVRTYKLDNIIGLNIDGKVRFIAK